MKIAIIADTHAGVRNDAPHFLDNQEKFYENVFFPRLEEEKVSAIIHAGDLFDRRKFINFLTLKRTKDMFLNRVQDLGIEMKIIPGNHDTYYKSSNEVNSLKELLGQYSKTVELIETPKVISFDGVDIGFLPWLNQSNHDEFMGAVRDMTCPILTAHLELIGHEMYAGQVADEGMSVDEFLKFDSVWTGHYHHKSSKGNIHYLGAISEYIWSDAEDDRGFHIYDTSSMALTYVKNPHGMFRRIYYADGSIDEMKAMREFDHSIVNGQIVRVIVLKKTYPVLFETFIDKLYECSPIDVEIIEDYSQFHESSIQIEGISSPVSAIDTGILIKKYIEDIVDPELDKARLHRHMNELYIEAAHNREDDDSKD